MKADVAFPRPSATCGGFNFKKSKSPSAVVLILKNQNHHLREI